MIQYGYFLTKQIFYKKKFPILNFFNFLTITLFALTIPKNKKYPQSINHKQNSINKPMQIPYSFLEKSANNQFKDMAFFQILKRKGPYIERSITKIQNDLFYKHKLPGTKMKNVSFIKEIRLTLTAYQTIVNEIKNDFMMTQLDSLGDSIHKLFVQMLSIIKFFSVIVLKQEKTRDSNAEVSLHEMKEKQLLTKKMQQQHKTNKVREEKEKQNDKFKQIQQLKYNFKELFKMQVNSDKENRLIESLWQTIVMETRNSAKQCILAKDSQLSKVIKDSCEYMYKNHTELDNIIRLTRQDISQAEKTIDTFTDKQYLLQQNEKNIHHMKQVAKKLIQVVKSKAYGKMDAMVQTSWTSVDEGRQFMTVKELEEKRKLELKIKNYEKTTQERQVYVGEMEMKVKKTEEMLRIANQKLKAKEMSSSDDDEDNEKFIAKMKSANHRNSIQVSKVPQTKFTNLSRKSKHQNFNSFKVNPKVSVINKFRQASFTAGNKNLHNLTTKNSNLSQQQLYQKTSNRSSATSNDFNIEKRVSHHSNNKFIQNMNMLLSKDDACSSPSLKSQKTQKTQKTEKSQKSGSVNKKFYQVRKSHLVLQAKSFEEISRRSQMSRAVFDEEKDDVKDGVIHSQEKDDIVSIENLDTYRESQVNEMSKPQIIVKQEKHSVEERLKNASSFSIIQTCKLTIKPLYLKRYLQPTYKHPVSQEKQSQPTNLSESKLLKFSKLKKATSHHELSRYFFEPLGNFDRFAQKTMYKENKQNLDIEKRKILSATASSSLNPRVQQKENLRHSSNENYLNVPQPNAMSLLTLKKQKIQKSHSLASENQTTLKGCIKNTLDPKDQTKKYEKSHLKKSSTTKQTVSFSLFLGAQNKRRNNSNKNFAQNKSSLNPSQINKVTIGQTESQYPFIISSNSAMTCSRKVIREQTQVLE